MTATTEKWKAEQRDWLVIRLRCLINKWLGEEAADGTQFMPDAELGRIAKGRTGGCARELERLLDELK